MPHPSTETRRSGTINIRIQPIERALIDRAAESLGKSRSDFMLEASRRAAEEALLDRTLFRVDSETYERFIELLDGPAVPNEKLQKLMQTRAPWE
ncbi:MAG: DUF1778 domain-containing protein [Aliidongia sp.]|jgi:uncharacterized protein (DUF1778 family)